jgi:hypothetical protein
MAGLLPYLIQAAVIYGPAFVRDIIALFKKGNYTIDDLDAVFNSGLQNSYDSYKAGTNTPIVLPAGA